VAAALLVSGVLSAAGFAGAAWWGGLAVLGQIVQLQLTVAGPFVRYQHLRPFTPDGTPPDVLVLLGVALALALAVLRPLSRARRGLPSMLASVGGGIALALVAVFLFVTSALPTMSPAAAAGELSLGFLLAVLNLALVIACAASVPAEALGRVRAAADRWLGLASQSPEPGGVDRFVLTAALFVVVASFALGGLSYQWHAHVPDEVSYLLHARYLAAGMLEMPPPPVREAFDVDLMTYEATRWYSPVPVGWSVVLAAGVKAGATWLVNPLLAGVALLLGYLLARELYDRRTSRLIVALLAVSPWFLFLAMTIMTHMLSMVAALGAALATARMRRTGAIAWALPAGALIALVALVRPLEGLLVALSLGVWSLRTVSGRWRLVPGVLMAVATVAVTAMVSFPYNRHFTGSPTRFPIMTYADSMYGPGRNDYGFGPDKGLPFAGLDPFPGHGIKDAAFNTILNTFATNIELFGWSTGSLLLVVWLVGARQARRADWLLVVAVLAIVGGHIPYWFSGGPDFGARYWWLALFPLVGLTARAILALDARVASQRAGAGRVLVAAGLLSASALLTFVPWRGIDKYFHYRGARPDVRELARGGRFGDGVVVVRGRRHPDYHSAVVYNPIDLSSRAPVYVWDRGDSTLRKLSAVYADRAVWVIDGPSVTRAGFRVVAGPITWEQARQIPRPSIERAAASAGTP